MLNPAAQLIDDLAACKTPAEWPTDLAERIAANSKSDQTFAREFIEMVLLRLPQGGTFVEETLSHLPESDWLTLVREAIAAYSANPENEGAIEVIAHGSLQNVSALHPFLPQLFDLQINSSSYYSAWPWRESGDTHFAFLKEKLQSPDESILRAAFQAALETRHPSVVAHAISYAPEDEVDEWLATVGLSRSGDSFYLLYDPKPQHIIFPEQYLTRPNQHPTWTLPKETNSTADITFGGTIPDQNCASCAEPLHHLITLNNVTIPTCLSCLGTAADELYFHHNPDGKPVPFVPPGTAFGTPIFSNPFKATTATLVATPSRWTWQDWGLSNGRENLHRVGGYPCWIQQETYLPCPQCTQKMHHLLQLDSELPVLDYDDFLWGSGGICYIQWCNACRISGQFIQCT